MYQVIPEDFSQIILKRLFIFFCFVLLAVLALHFYHTIVPSATTLSTEGNKLEINKSDIVFSSFNL